MNTQAPSMTALPVCREKAPQYVELDTNKCGTAKEKKKKKLYTKASQMSRAAFKIKIL